MHRLLPLAALLLGACQAPVGLVRDRGPDTLVAFTRDLRSPQTPPAEERLARQTAADLSAAVRDHTFSCDLPIALADIRSLKIASDYRAEELFQHYKQPGTGVPVVVEAAPTTSYHPPGGRFLPATATLSPQGKLHLANPLADRSLAADFTIPFAFHSEQHDDDSARFKGLVFAKKLQPSFHIHDPYDPHKIPLVMVHGLGSAPCTWNQLTNLVLGTPELRTRYQVWHYFYPTGVPFLEAGEEFRLRFERFRLTLAEESGQAPPLHPAVFVSHSLGGLMVKTLASDSGDTLQEAYGTNRREPFLHFSRSPHIARAIFVASPLNGSSLAAFPAAEIASFIPSIPSLADDSPVMQAFASIPIDPAIPFNVLLGKKFSLSDTSFSDGVVSFKNASVTGAESTTVISSDTHNVHTLPEALQEIQRILYLH